jgi:hypothetical protein
MRTADLLRLLNRRPFKQFSFYLTDGSHYEIRHPEQAVATRSSLLFGLRPSDQPEAPVERMLTISFLHIIKLEHDLMSY